MARSHALEDSSRLDGVPPSRTIALDRSAKRQSDESDRSALRACFAGEAGALATPVDCAAAWLALTCHELEIAECFQTEERAYLLLRERPAQEPRAAALVGRNLTILERHLRGTERKALALELELSQATVAQILVNALRAMGFTQTPALLSPVLVMLLHAATSREARSLLRISRAVRHEQRYIALSTSLESDVWRDLPRAQRTVLRERAYGGTYAEIAVRRCTSPRTVANQVAAASRRLGISGRLDLLQRMATVGGSSDVTKSR